MNKLSKKIISLILASIFTLSLATSTVQAETQQPVTQPENVSQTEEVTEDAAAKEEARKTLEEQRAELEAKLKESKNKLSKYEKNAEATAEYIDDLDERIGYLNIELSLLDCEIKEAQGKVDALNKDIKVLKTEIDQFQEEYDKLQGELDKLDSKFQKTYNAYCLRMRALYISGYDSIIVALLTSKDLAQLISRYEMIKAISKSDSALLRDVNKQITKISAAKKEMDTKKAELDVRKADLDTKRAQRTSEKAKIEAKQNEVATKKVALAEERAKSDALLAQYTEQTEMYGEYRYEDEALIAQVNSEIDSLLSGLKSPEEVTTASSKNVKNKKKPESTSGNLYYNSNAVLNLTYPAPNHYAVSQAYGHYRNGKAHTGIDFPYPVGSKVVAAQKGIVITVKRLNYSYGYYVMIYHGTDKQGRKIVTLYAHNSSILVSVGQSVKKGQQIAKGGSTGNSTGPHCHFELIIDGTKVNPASYFSK